MPQSNKTGHRLRKFAARLTMRQQHHAQAELVQTLFELKFVFKRFCTGGLDVRAGVSAPARVQRPAVC